MTQTIEIFSMKDGFYAGRKTKSGKMAAGSYRLTDEDIMTMFTTLFDNYVAETGEKTLKMKDSEGNMFVTVKMKADASDGGKAE